MLGFALPFLPSGFELLRHKPVLGRHFFHVATSSIGL